MHVASKLNSFSAYLCLIRLLYNLKVPFDDRMSMTEFEIYAKKVKQSQNKKIQ